MLMTVLFYIIVVCFALALIAWSASELMHVWQAGVIMSLLFLVGTVALVVRLVAQAITGDVLAGEGIWMLFALVFAAACLYLHFRLFGTMVMPVAAVILVALEMLQHMGRWPALGIALPLEGQPWLGAAIALAMIGLALALACAILAVSVLSRRGRLSEAERLEAALEEIEDEAAFRAHSLRVQFIDVTRRMPRVLSHLAWWALAALTFALGAYVLWCNTLFGSYWIWQPLFALAAAAWVLLFCGKDMLFARSI